ncbi:MAG: hypothetical protein GEU88_02680 [Solirubrobacterales bacterium]|nr:hypothetical protein [Solirubrobacterales bacterium]
MRALVLSDTHFGAWTGDALLRHEHHLARLAPQLDDVDELIFLGDLFDFLFGTVEEAFAAADGLFALLREKLQGKRFVFLAGNHDHHLVTREAEDLLELRIATGLPADQLVGELERRRFFRRFLERRLDGVEVDIRYPAYTFGDVLLTHGHYLDPHARASGPVGSRLLTRALWSIAAGGPEEPRTVEDYESMITLLTELLFTIAQLPHGTAAQRAVQHAAQRVGNAAGVVTGPIDAARRLARRGGPSSAPGGGPPAAGRDGLPDTSRAYERARTEAGAGPDPSAAAGAAAAGHQLGRVVRASDPIDRSLEAFARVVENLGWARETDKIVFAHTHQPLADGSARTGPRVRYWNTGSWIYEPDLSSHDAYRRYLRYGWPGTAVLIDTEEPEPRLLELLRDENPLKA